MSKKTMQTLANLARRNCGNERLAHHVADTIERSADIHTAARDVSAMFGRNEPSAKLSAICEVLFDEGKVARPVNASAFRIDTANAANTTTATDADYRAKRTAEIQSYGKRPPVRL